MLVSTIIPVFNRPSMLRDAVESVLQQSHRPIEVIVVDDGSTDETPSVIRSLIREHGETVRTVRVPNSGPGLAREAGRQLAKGDFIQYLDSDDLLLPQKFEIQIDALQRDVDAGIAYGKTHHSSVGGNLMPVPFKRTGDVFRYLFPELLVGRWWSTSTPLYRRCVADAIGPWQPLGNEEDWEYDARAAALGIKLVYCDTFVSVHRWHDGDRLHRGGNQDPSKLRDRARAHKLIYDHARAAGIDEGFQEMRHFSRALFLLSRQCGAAALAAEAQNLFDLAREASGPGRSRGLDFRLYRMMAGTVGWSTAGRIACRLDRLRP